ncbi:hypothetical protein VB779_09295 [Haloarculaceae archaeon H-GB11]|nr:hypothetical protein [Haloarculaceae archaeon H-GB11]
MEALRRYRSEFKSRHQRFHHFVISPPANWDPAADTSWEAALDVVKEILDVADLEGTAFYHPYKGKDGDDRGFWKRMLFDEIEWDDVRDELRFDPHFHVIAVGHQCPGGDTTRAVEHSTGWVLHRITKQDSNVSLYDEHDLARAVTYCLSHTGLYETDQDTTRAAYRYCGANTQRAKPEDASVDVETWMDAVVRRVAPKTLGLPYQSLACQNDRAADVVQGETHDHKVDVDAAEASRSPYSASSASSTSTANSEEFDDKILSQPAADGDDVDVTCRGRMLNIAKAPKFLEDEEWCSYADHVGDLREAWVAWRDEIDYLD